MALHLQDQVRYNRYNERYDTDTMIMVTILSRKNIVSDSQHSLIDHNHFTHPCPRLS